MCLPAVPLAIAAFAASSASAAAQYSAQSSAAKAQGKYQNQMYSSTQQAASQNYDQSVGQMGLRMSQEGDLASQQGIQNTIATQNALGSAAVSAGESNVSGNSVNELFNQFGAIQAANNATLQQNLKAKQQQGQQELLGVRSGSLSRIADRTPAPVALPSLLATGLQIGGDALQSYDFYQRQSNTGPYAPSKNSYKA